MKKQEYLDVLDEKGNKTGKATRDEVHQKGLWHRAVHVWIVNSKGELLLQRRAKNIKAYPDCWDISAAGHITAGDTSIHAAARETEEELGLKFPPEQFQLLGTVIQNVVLNNNTYFNNEFNDIYLVKQDIDLSVIKKQKDEVSDIKWVSKTELEEWVKQGKEDLVPHKMEYELLFKTLDNL